MKLLKTSKSAKNVRFSKKSYSSMAIYAAAARAENTRRAYWSDLRHFQAWGGKIPAKPEMVAAYVADCAKQYAYSTIHRRMAAITHAHRERGFPSPIEAPLVRNTLQGIRRLHGISPRQARPILPNDIKKMLAKQRGIVGLRNRALVLLGFAGAFRRSELVAIEIQDLAFVRSGLLVSIRRCKTDQEGQGRIIAIPKGRSPYCPVKAVIAWIKAATLVEGKLFRAVSRHGHVAGSGLSAQVVGLVVKKLAFSAGLAATEYSAHSLRSGLVTSAALAGVDAWKIRQVTGHKSDAILARYIRTGKLFDNSPYRGIF